MFCEEKVKKAHSDSLHVHMASRHFDVGPAVCLFFSLLSTLVTCEICTVLNVHVLVIALQDTACLYHSEY